MDKLKRLKQQYVKVVKKGLTGDYDDEIYPHRRDTYYRHYSVKQEKSSFFLHEIEYRSYFLKLRKKRGRALMCSWTTEHTPAFCYGGKNWKHNSKRKHQYYREKN
ncbi:hypothetical protein RFY44_04215 [Acinetobacter bereziniae]|jgi:hypothetical protein|uniref:Uncharacterized protein n=2 Tax=Acinetobacter bereziniae TaxID=106648 RepID=A0A8I1AGI7_ACIBZ|nr:MULTISPECIES: hypothetical protein [Acinetobacter]MEC8125382.1 hypothetical protein [Pseudomonadota bacterium]ENV21677.1 hypothetical protein F963_02307 [Acinetobacter bereziniae NIPH 3]MBJ8445700.1 hypothetical protein [Acinetobacter bereziniae]MBJ8453510.1 hypothetical protein [Acinetobacter bereziniae]MBJ8458355.1 hypothetical protein [Acinetobacter bereziniae]